MTSNEDEGIPSADEVFEIDAKDVVKLREIGRGSSTPIFSFPLTIIAGLSASLIPSPCKQPYSLAFRQSNHSTTTKNTIL